ncbi:hypothetical protein L6V77_11820 [Myxococcota bacterium]|nr:hypothetical protein [Myxococcota bacterium]
MQTKASEVGAQSIPYPEYVLRVLFTLFTPAVKTAVDFNYPLDTVKDMMTLALWQEARRKHSTINLISVIFGKSTRTVKALSARFNKGGYFETSETNLMRRIEDLLRQRPLSMDEIADRVPHTAEFDSTRLAVGALINQGRIEALPRTPGTPARYQVVARHHDLVAEADWEARLDALTEHLEAVTETIRRRMISDEPETAAARTFSFRARPEDVEAFREAFFEFVRTRYRDLEEAAADDPAARCYALYAGLTEMEEDDR